MATAAMQRGVAHLLDDGQDPGFVVVITVSTHTEVDLLRVCVRLVCRGELENAA